MALKRQRQQRSLAVPVSIIIAIGCICLVAAGWWQRDFLEDSYAQLSVSIKNVFQSSSVEGSDTQKSQPPDKEKSTAVNIVISAIGDCLPGDENGQIRAGSFGDEYAKHVETQNYFFGNVSNYLESDDLTIGNLECPLTLASIPRQKGVQSNPSQPTESDELAEPAAPIQDGTEVANVTPAAVKPKSYFWFRGKPEYAKVLAQGSIEAVCLANNHMLDFGDQGRLDTIKAVEDQGITPFDASRPAIVDVQGQKVGLVAYVSPGKWLKAQIVSDIKKFKKDGADLVIVSFHWGEEMARSPNALQKELGRFTIESGANLVLGHHPHVIQPVEKWKDGYIVYSLGNFMFGGNRNPKDKDSFIYRQTITFNEGKVEMSEPIYIPCRISSVTNRNDYRPTPVAGDEAEEILARIRKVI